MSACTRESCDGSIAADGYCDTCGYAGTPAAAPASAAPPPPPPPSATPRRAAPAVAAGVACTEAGCDGTVASDGYCNTCGMQPSTAARHVHAGGGASPVSSGSTATATIAAPEAPATSRRVASATGGGTSRRIRTERTTSSSAELGAGLVRIAPTVAGDPSNAVMSEEKIASVLGEKPEGERFCSACGQPVGRSQGDKPGRIQGFCGNCRTRFDFVTNTPKLTAGEVVGGQYKILGPIAHGGMGWIYLGQDTAVSNRWVVLKGLLNEDDPDAVASAVAERQFLARIEHGSIVNIYNFVTWEGAGYIVMEFVGGQSLNSKLKDRRKSNGGQPNPLPVTEAIAYMLGVLPALGYLHDLGLVYNDLKPANMLAVGDTVKLIDVGGVMQADDDSAAIFGTQGFQAPEVASMGPSVSSDLFTVGRTLAVLREIVAISERTPRATSSNVFGGDRLAGIMLEDASVVGADWRALPAPKISAGDPGAAFLYDLPELDPESTIRLLDEALGAGTAPDSTEVRLRRAREIIDAGGSAVEVIRAVEGADPWDWRVAWYRSLQALRDEQFKKAAEGFSRVWTDLPGELAPKQAVALSAELAGEYQRAADLYAEVIGVDSSYVSAAFGLARCRVAAGDRHGAVDAYRAVPPSSATYTEAQVASARVLAGQGADAAPSAVDIAAAAETIEAARIDGAAKSKLATEVLAGALQSIEDGAIPEDANARVFGNPLTATGLRRSLETAYRDLARVAETAEERFELVDKANAVRVPSLI